jgi:glycosyltransferase involved in cell wall biosynthesis
MPYQKKKILCIVTSPYQIPKGSSLRVDSVLQKISKNNEVDLLAYPSGKDPQYPNVKVHRVFGHSRILFNVSEVSAKKLFLDLCVLIRAFNMMLFNHYDIVHCEDFEAASAGFALSLIFRKPKYVYDLHNTINDNLRITRKPVWFINFAKWIARMVYSRYDLIITNWNIYRNVSKKKKFLLYDETNLNVKRIKIPTKKKYLAYAGNFQKYQGVEEFVKIYAEVNPRFDLVLVGKATKEIKSLVRRLRIEKRVHFTGMLDIEESNHILINSEMCLIPRIDGDQPGLKMIHHLMLGKISLATDIPANRELLRDGYNSILYSSKKELMKILKDIDGGKLKTKRLEEGIKETQEKIQKIWSEEYFNRNYFKDGKR